MSHDSPYKRVYENGRAVYIARYTDPTDGKRKYASPAWNRGRSTFDLKRDAQRAIDEAIEAALHPVKRRVTVRDYLDEWLRWKPRSDRTDRTNESRIKSALPARVAGKELGDYYLDELRRPHAEGVVRYLLVDKGRAVNGVRGVLGSLSAMLTDAIHDELCEKNPFMGMKVKANDPRCRRAPTDKRVWDYSQMHHFAQACGEYEVLVRILSDCGLRIGEALGLTVPDYIGAPGEEALYVHHTAWEGRVWHGTKTDHGEAKAGRTVPVPPGLARLLDVYVPTVPENRVELANRYGEYVQLMFPSPRRKVLRVSRVYDNVWHPAQKATGMDIRPHEMRHSYLSHLAAAGINEADAAAVAGHTIETMLGTYVHPLRRSDAEIRKAIGG